MSVLFPFVLTFLFSLIMTRMIIASGDSFQWLMRSPTGDRWHQQTTPSLGGIAIFAAFAISFFAFDLHTSNTLPLFFGGTLIFLLGLWDDLHPLPPYAKLIGQIAVACLMVLMGVHLTFTGNPFIYIPLTILWIVGITNAFNLLDNMDGLAGGIAIIAAMVLGFLLFQTASPISLELIGILCASLLGFLVFNVHPARIFMGDCGSQWIGFTLASMTILDTWQSASNLFILLVTPALILAVPIFDTTFVTLNRKFHGRPVSQGGRDHTSHRLVALGFDESRTVWFLWLLSLSLGAIAVMARFYNFETAALMICGGLIFVLVVAMLLADVNVYGTAAKAATQKRRFPSWPRFSNRRLVEIMIDTLLIGASYSAAYLLRFDWHLDAYNLSLLEKTLPIVVATKLPILLLAGLYAGIWTYIDFENVGRLLRSSIYASFGTILVILGFYRFEGFSRTVFFIDFILLFLLMAGTRALLRMFRESILAFPEEGVRVLIVGAGDSTRNLLRDIRKHRNWNLRPVLIVDDDVRKQGRSIMGIPIKGPKERIRDWVEAYNVQKVIISVPSATAEQQKALEEAAKTSGIPWVNIPSVHHTLLA